MATEVLNREDLINKIWQYKGKVSLVAESYGVSTQTIYNYAERYNTVKNAIDLAKRHNDILRVDIAETKLDAAVRNDKPWAIAYTLNNSPEAKRRGWGPKAQIEHSGETAIKLTWGDDATD